MADCPSENELVDFAEGRLSAEARSSIHHHIDTCSDCRALLSDLACAEASPVEATAVLTPHSKPPAQAIAILGMPKSERFQILRKLGQGGMGVVYEAIDRERNSRVALKTLRSMSPDALLRFKNEFRALQDLEHHNLVRLYDLVEENGQWWFTMELLSGVDFLTHVQGDPRQAAAEQKRIRSVGVAETLPAPIAPSDLLAAAPPSAPSPIQVCLDEVRLRAALLQLAEGLHGLHSAGKVHRDIKPHNVLVTTTGRVVILDFGLVGDRAQKDSAVVGTIAYMAPEQAAAEPVGSAADWYSVGVMLFEALTGKLPTAGGTMEALAGKLRGQLPSAKTLNPDAPADLDALCSELLTSNPAQRPAGMEILRRLRSATVSPANNHEARLVPSAASPLFVGRPAELAALRDAFNKSQAGQSTLVLIEGESGIGKSALVRHFTTLLSVDFPDAVVLTGRCYEREAVPYKAFDGIIDALARYMKRLPKDKAAALLPRRAASLVQSFPVLGLVPALAEAPLTSTEANDPKEQRSRIFAALRELFVRLCDRHPLLLWIDDLQWTDSDSLALLTYVMSPPDAPSLLLLCTLRPLQELRPEGLSDEALRQFGTVQRLRLGPLQASDACELAQRLAQQSSSATLLDANAIAAEAGGHPLFLDELVRRAQEAPGATSVLRLEDAIRARVASFPAMAQRLLRLSALAARPLRSEVAGAASELPPAELSDCVTRLQAAHLLRTTPRHESGPSVSSTRVTIEPYHDRVRETVVERLDETERRDLHRELAAALEMQNNPESDLLAHHYQAAGEPKKAGRYAAQAAAQAARQMAFDRAADLYRAALDSGAFAGAEQNELSACLGDALAHAGRAAEAGQAYLRAASGIEVERALVLRQQAANQFLRGGHIEEGVEVLNGLLRGFGLRIGSSKVFTFIKGIGIALRLRLRLRLRGLRYRLRPESEIALQDLQRHDLCWMVNQALTAGSLRLRGFDFIFRVVWLALQLGEPRRLTRALSWLAYVGVTIGGVSAAGRATSLLATARRLLTEQKIEDPYTHGFIDQMESWTAGELGQLRRSRELSERAEQSFFNRCPGTTWERTNVRFGRLFLDGFMGNYPSLVAELPQLLRESRERNDRNAIQLLGCLHAHPYFLAPDDKGQAEQTLASWGLGDALEADPSHVVFHLLMHVRISLYFAGGVAGYRRYLDLSQRMTTEAVLLTPRALRAHIFLEGITCRLAALAEGSDDIDRPRLLAECNKALKEASGFRLPWTLAWTLGLQAGLAALRGQRHDSIALFRQAIPALEAESLGLHAAVCRRRLGELVGGQEGAGLIEQADGWMRRQTIKNPARFARILLPECKAL